MKEKEHQSIEWKESWQDEYLKWICGYANAYGGTIYIGTDDNGNVVGIDNARDLLERIPNKITDTMGIIADVNLLYKGELEYLQIIVDKYPSLISFRGKYYYRSGSTMREITGKELERALLKTQGRTWDGVPLPKLTVSDLKQDAIQLFKDKAVKRGRLTKEEVSVEDTILMDKLHLIDEDGYLIRAAMLAFYKDPEKWVTGSYIKIGYFGKSDLVYQDEVHGPLIEQVDKTVDLVYTKYMKALIDYEGVQRIEQFMFHKDAFREILLNAIVHKDYSGCNPIQISVYEDKIYIWNDGEMPPNLDSIEENIKDGVPESEICVIAPVWNMLYPFSKRLQERLPNVKFDAPDITPIKRDPLNVFYKMSRLLLTEPSIKSTVYRNKLAKEILAELEIYTGESFDIESTDLLNITISAKKNCEKGSEFIEEGIKNVFDMLHCSMKNYPDLMKIYEDFIEKMKYRLENPKFELSDNLNTFKAMFKEKEGVVINTCHGVKGEEYHTVIAFGLLYGKVPSIYTSYDKMNEEANKLLYVIASRAKKEYIYSQKKEDVIGIMVCDSTSTRFQQSSCSKIIELNMMYNRCVYNEYYASSLTSLQINMRLVRPR